MFKNENYERLYFNLKASPCYSKPNYNELEKLIISLYDIDLKKEIDMRLEIDQLLKMRIKDFENGSLIAEYIDTKKELELINCNSKSIILNLQKIKREKKSKEMKDKMDLNKKELF